MITTDSLIKIALRSVESVQVWIKLLDRAGKARQLRELLEWLDSLPALDRDLQVIANRLRRTLTQKSDPDKTPVERKP